MKITEKKLKKYKSRTDLKRLRWMKDKDIDYSDIPEIPDSFWNDAKIIVPPHKIPVSMRFDRDLLEWFKKQGPGYQTRINRVLRYFMDSQLNKLHR